MTSELHRAIRDAAPGPSAPAPFDRLQTRGRRRRAAMRTGGALAGIAAIGAVATILPGVLADDRDIGLEVATSPQPSAQSPTLGAEQFTPPAPYPPTPSIPDATWYGTPGLWTVVPDNQRPQKIAWRSINFEGGADEPLPEIEVRYERLDDPDHEPIVQDATSAPTSRHSPTRKELPTSSPLLQSPTPRPLDDGHPRRPCWHSPRCWAV